MHTAFGSVELNSVTQVARMTTIQHQDAGCNLRERP